MTIDFNDYIVIDLETDGFIDKGRIPNIICYSWCSSEGSGADTSAHKLEAMIEDKIPVFHNAKFDVPILRYHNVEVRTYHDTMLMSYVLDTSDDHSLKAKGAKYEYDFKTKGFELTDELLEYAEQDAKVTWEYFCQVFNKIMSDEDNRNIYKLELDFLSAPLNHQHRMPP